MTAQEAISYIHSVSWKGSIPGLGRTRELLQRMGNPHHKLKFIHIAGTNGKGSTAAMLASVLEAAGYRTGLYTSPYIFRFHERMQVNRQEISDAQLAEVTEFVRPHAEAMAEHPTEFELVTAIAMEYFFRQKADIVVLEAGMGGSLDSTNVISAPEACVLCNIGLDHTEYLGDTLAAIAETKAGIIKPGTECILYPSSPEAKAAVQEKCRKEEVPLHTADFRKLQPADRSLAGQRFHWGSIQDLTVPLLGRHQLKNAAVVLTVLEVLQQKGWRISTEHIRTGLADTRWPGRFQIVGTDPLFIVDGGHNPQCMEALVQNLEDYLQGCSLTVLTGVMADKDRGAMYPPLLPYCRRFITVTPDNPRAMDAGDLAAYLQSLGAEATACPTVADGVHTAAALARAEQGAVLACGSLYMVGQITEAARKIK